MEEREEISGVVDLDRAAAAAWRAAQPGLDEVINGAHVALAGFSSEAERQEFSHRLRHCMLHWMLGELVADYLIHDASAYPTTSTLDDLMRWSHRQLSRASADPPASHGAARDPQPASNLTH